MAHSQVQQFTEQQRMAAGANIRRLRKQRRWSQVELADFLNTTRARIGRIEKGKAELNLGEIWLLAEKWALPPSAFIDPQSGQQAVRYGLLPEEIRQLERQVQQLAEEHQARAGFLAGMGHNLRTPFNDILGLAAYWAGFDGSAGQDLAEATFEMVADWNVVFQQGRRLFMMITTVLDLAGVEAGLLRLNRRLVDPHEVIAQAVREAHALFGTKEGVVLTVETAVHLPKVRGDKERLIQILLHLLSNAIKFTDEGTITVKAYPVQEALAIAVADTGVGLSPEEQALLFEPLQRSGIKQTESGVGLGLCLVRALVEMHHGRIEVLSEAGRGSTFTLFLPAVHTHTNATQQRIAQGRQRDSRVTGSA